MKLEKLKKAVSKREKRQKIYDMLDASDFVLLFVSNHWKNKGYHVGVDQKMMILHLGKKMGLWEHKSAAQLRKQKKRTTEEIS